ncbi:hypothetical protein Tco_1462220 [Tanacetum coccineum]
MDSNNITSTSLCKAGKLVNEEPISNNLISHGAFGGPKAGRLRVLNNDLQHNREGFFKQPRVLSDKSIENLNFQGRSSELAHNCWRHTIADTKMELILSSNDANAEAKPNVNQVTMVVYNADYSNTYGFEDEASMKYQRSAAAEDVAQEFGSEIAGHTWILESIAACRVNLVRSILREKKDGNECLIRRTEILLRHFFATSGKEVLGLVRSVSYCCRLEKGSLAASSISYVLASGRALKGKGRKERWSLLLGTWLVHSLAHELAASPEATKGGPRPGKGRVAEWSKAAEPGKLGVLLLNLL